MLPQRQPHAMVLTSQFNPSLQDWSVTGQGSAALRHSPAAEQVALPSLQ